jgi:hypothetical protein
MTDHAIDIVAPDLSEILADLDASGIDVSISWASDKGIEVDLGVAAAGLMATAATAAEWLRAQAIRHYPDSEFATKHRRALQTDGHGARHPNDYHRSQGSGG